MDAVLDFLRNLMPYLLPILVVVGQKLKQLPFVNNQLIPWLLVALNVGRLWVMRLGWGLPGAGEGQPLEPLGDVGMAIGMPIFAVLGIAGLGGALWSVVGFGAQLAVDHFLVNKTHKGLKYRAMYKLAEKSGLIQPGSSAGLKAQVKW